MQAPARKFFPKFRESDTNTIIKRKNPETRKGLRVDSPKSVFRLNDFLAIIVAAAGANTMGHLHFVALRTFNQVGSGQFPVGTTGVATGFRHFSLRYCHCKYTSSHDNGEFNI
jgi:hypothetical protein